ncbi:MAG: sugar nucleotide-binding protein [Clostridia bacterium]|nr:sugar nucleotide-binding protein [Clostridia bacterium]
MKMLVTGPRGFVGARIMAQVKDAAPCPSLRDADADTVKRLVDEFEPDMIVHTAAMSDISECEKDPAGSYHANVEIPVMLACTKVKTVVFSTDQVYRGCEGNGPYTEETAKPANLYARHKLEMEERVLDISPDIVVLRATWMYDMPMYGVPNRGNFLVNMLRGGELSFSSTQHRAVTYVREAAGHISRAAALPGGVYNYGSENSLTMLETAQWLKNELGLPVVLRDAGPLPHLWMDCGKLKKAGVCFQTALEGLGQCLRDYGLRAL